MIIPQTQENYNEKKFLNILSYTDIPCKLFHQDTIKYIVNFFFY